MHKIYKCIWMKLYYGNSGVTSFIVIATKLVFTWMQY